MKAKSVETINLELESILNRLLLDNPVDPEIRLCLCEKNGNKPQSPKTDETQVDENQLIETVKQFIAENSTKLREGILKHPELKSICVFLTQRQFKVKPHIPVYDLELNDNYEVRGFVNKQESLNYEDIGFNAEDAKLLREYRLKRVALMGVSESFDDWSHIGRIIGYNLENLEKFLNSILYMPEVEAINFIEKYLSSCLPYSRNPMDLRILNQLVKILEKFPNANFSQLVQVDQFNNDLMLKLHPKLESVQKIIEKIITKNLPLQLSCDISFNSEAKDFLQQVLALVKNNQYSTDIVFTNNFGLSQTAGSILDNYTSIVDYIAKIQAAIERKQKPTLIISPDAGVGFEDTRIAAKVVSPSTLPTPAYSTLKPNKLPFDGANEPRCVDGPLIMEQNVSVHSVVATQQVAVNETVAITSRVVSKNQQINELDKHQDLVNRTNAVEKARMIFKERYNKKEYNRGKLCSKYYPALAKASLLNDKQILELWDALRNIVTDKDSALNNFDEMTPDTWRHILLHHDQYICGIDSEILTNGLYKQYYVNSESKRRYVLSHNGATIDPNLQFSKLLVNPEHPVCDFDIQLINERPEISSLFNFALMGEMSKHIERLSLATTNYDKLVKITQDRAFFESIESLGRWTSPNDDGFKKFLATIFVLGSLPNDIDVDEYLKLPSCIRKIREFELQLNTTNMPIKAFGRYVELKEEDEPNVWKPIFDKAIVFLRDKEQIDKINKLRNILLNSETEFKLPDIYKDLAQFELTLRDFYSIVYPLELYEIKDDIKTKIWEIALTDGVDGLFDALIALQEYTEKGLRVCQPLVCQEHVFLHTKESRLRELVELINSHADTNEPPLKRKNHWLNAITASLDDPEKQMILRLIDTPSFYPNLVGLYRKNEGHVDEIQQLCQNLIQIENAHPALFADLQQALAKQIGWEQLTATDFPLQFIGNYALKPGYVRPPQLPANSNLPLGINLFQEITFNPGEQSIFRIKLDKELEGIVNKLKLSLSQFIDLQEYDNVFFVRDFLENYDNYVLKLRQSSLSQEEKLKIFKELVGLKEKISEAPKSVELNTNDYIEDESEALDRSWATLLKEHLEKHDAVDVVSLRKQWLVFVDRLKDFNPQIKLRTILTTCKTNDLPYTLSQILHVLENVSDKERQAQLDAVNKLDFSSFGASYAFSNEGFTFLHENMGIIPRRYAAIDDSGSLSYKLDLGRLYEALRSDFNSKKLKESAFFRYIACSNARQHIDFYIELIKAIRGQNDDLQFMCVAMCTAGTRNGNILAEQEKCVTLLNKLQHPTYDFIVSWMTKLMLLQIDEQGLPNIDEMLIILSSIETMDAANRDKLFSIIQSNKDKPDQLIKIWANLQKLQVSQDASENIERLLTEILEKKSTNLVDVLGLYDTDKSSALFSDIEIVRCFFMLCDTEISDIEILKQNYETFKSEYHLFENPKKTIKVLTQLVNNQQLSFESALNYMMELTQDKPWQLSLLSALTELPYFSEIPNEKIENITVELNNDWPKVDDERKDDWIRFLVSCESENISELNNIYLECIQKFDLDSRALVKLSDNTKKLLNTIINVLGESDFKKLLANNPKFLDTYSDHLTKPYGNIICRLFFNSREEISSETWDSLVEQLNGADDETIKNLNEVFTNNAIVPTISGILRKLKQPDFDLDKNPYAIEKDESKLDEERIQYALKNIRTLSGPSDINVTSDLDNLKNVINEQKSKTTNELQTYIHDYEPKNSSEINAELLAALRELIFRSSGKYVNSTQMIAIIQALKAKQNIGLQMNTGEGKTITFALMNAYRTLTSEKAVDVLTENATLIGRDMKEWEHFYRLCDIPINLVTTNCKVDDYIKDRKGINFAACGNMALFVAQNSYHGNLGDTWPNLLALDECDHFLYDEKKRFNYARMLSGDDSFQSEYYNPLAWLYPHINAIINVDRFKTCSTRGEEVEFLKQTILDAYPKHPPFPSDKHIDELINAAMVAKKLQEGIDFQVINETRTIDGKVEKVRFARIIKDGRTDYEAQWGNGVHQLLHTRLNTEASNRGEPANFFISPDQQVVCTLGAKNLLDMYKDNGIVALSATVGVLQELAESELKYNLNFIEIPPHQKSKRKNNDPIFCDDRQFLTVIKHRILEAQKQQSPILIICKTPKDVDELYAALRALPEFNNKPINTLAGKSPDVESKIIGAAGKKSQITISTAMMSRGANIELEDDKHGLHVYQTYYARERLNIQVAGRSGRQGQPGLYGMVINKSTDARFRQIIGSFWGLDNAFIADVISAEERKEIFNRLIEEAISDIKFLMQNSLLVIKDGTNTSEMSQKLRLLLDKFDKQLDKERRSETQLDINTLLKNMVAFVHAELTHDECKSSFLGNYAKYLCPNSELEKGIQTIKDLEDFLREKRKDIKNLYTPDAINLSFNSVTQSKAASKTVMIGDDVRPGYAAIRDTLFYDTREFFRGNIFKNTRAWWNGEGALFADTMSFILGYRPFMGNTRRVISKYLQKIGLFSDSKAVDDRARLNLSIRS